MESILTPEEEQLLHELQAIKENDFQLPTGQDPFAIVLKIIDHLGSPDPVLRDELGYTVLARWIYRQKLIEPEQMRSLLPRLVSNQMWFSRIGEKDTDSVFLRSFTSLVIELILERDKMEHFLSQQEFKQVLDAVKVYCQQEMDLRGYVTPGGWAHAAAHVSDVLAVCAESRYVQKEECLQIAQCIQNLLKNADDVFRAEEDERLARVFSNMMESGKMSLDEICDWIEQEKFESESADYVVKMIFRINWKHLLRSVYFQLQKKNALNQDEEKRFMLVIQSFGAY